MGFIGKMKRDGTLAAAILIATSVAGMLLGRIIAIPYAAIASGFSEIVYQIEILLRQTLYAAPQILLLIYLASSFNTERRRFFFPLVCILYVVWALRYLIPNLSYIHGMSLAYIAIDLYEMVFFGLMILAYYKGMKTGLVRALAIVLLAANALVEIYSLTTVVIYFFGWGSSFPFATLLERILSTVFFMSHYVGLMIVIPKVIASRRKPQPAAQFGSAPGASMAGLQAELTELARQYDCGEITYEEFSARKTEILKRI